MSDETVEMTEAFTAFLTGIVPEHAADLSQIIATQSITFHVDDAAERIKFTSGSHPSGPQPIEVGRKGLVRLWAHSFSSVLGTVLFDERRRGSTGLTRLPVAQWQIQAANDALHWAMRADVKLKYAQRHRLEYSLPTPPASLFAAVRTKSEFVTATATDVFRNALAFLLLHEIAHIVNRDTKVAGETETPFADPDPDQLNAAIHQEKRADQWAAERLLGVEGEDEAVRLVRRMGVATASLWLTVIRVYIDHVPGSHPPGWDRLYETLNPYLDVVDPIWGFVVISLMTHLHTAGRVPKELPDLGPDRESANRLLDHISRLFL